MSMAQAVLAPVQGAADSVSADAHEAAMSECEALLMVPAWARANRSIAPPCVKNPGRFALT